MRKNSWIVDILLVLTMLEEHFCH